MRVVKFQIIPLQKKTWGVQLTTTYALAAYEVQSLGLLRLFYKLYILCILSSLNCSKNICSPMFGVVRFLQNTTKFPSLVPF